jgi:hypothetical protein
VVEQFGNAHFAASSGISPISAIPAGKSSRFIASRRWQDCRVGAPFHRRRNSGRPYREFILHRCRFLQQHRVARVDKGAEAIAASRTNDGESRMRKIVIALLATTLIGSPVFAASNNQKQPQTKQQQTSQIEPPKQQQTAQDNQTQQNLPRREIRQAQQALNKDGFKVGRADGRLGPETEAAIKQFQQSKQIQPSGQLDQQTMADLGLDTSRQQK